MGMDSITEAGLVNVDLIEQVYQQYLENPASVSVSWKRYFEQIETAHQQFEGFPRQKASRPSPKGGLAPALSALGDMRVFNLIHAYRSYGHLKASVNPIATHVMNQPAELELSRFGFSESDWEQGFPTYGLLANAQASLKDIVAVLNETYCGKIGVEYVNLQDAALETWLQAQIEPTRFTPNLNIDQKRHILQHLNKSELFEVFLHTKYTGQKRFSLEGGETLIPILASIVETGSHLGVEEVYLGMAHRGRLNVLSNILNKSYTDIFSEFEEGYIPNSFEGSGDVKYHKGFESTTTTTVGKAVKVNLAANPSHLEAVAPVVQGQARARQIVLGEEYKQEKVVPIIIHGDAAVAGQGIVYETLQLYKLPGYSTGGTIHIVINNQIGFTTLPKDARSTLYCTDIARTFGAPVFHVNAEDPEGCVYATNLAIELRQRFHCDVFIELNCYRKYGHNEGDEPAFTQPLEYQLIRQKKPIRELYRDDLIQQGVLERQVAESLEEEFKASLQEALKETKEPPKKSQKKASSPKSTPNEHLFDPIPTGVPLETLKDLSSRFCRIPEGFNVNRKLSRLLEQRMEMISGDPGTRSIDWGMGEHLAFATLLEEGTHVRLSGQDSRRGTFSHRHAMWVDQKQDAKYFPLSNLKKNQGRFDVFNSPLSEYSVLGFEFGYSMTRPTALVLWEAQFGDFCNGAQIIIDQFLATSEQKWGQSCPLALLLPHGYEGQGPEHSSARMERFLQLCGDHNIQACYPSTPAQCFHLLRRQVHRANSKPLVIFTPKSLLRHPACISAPQELAEGSFQEIIDDPAPAKKTKRLILCTGKVYYDLVQERESRKHQSSTIVRIEQLYPGNTQGLQAIYDKYNGFEEVIWVQEEPRNMGAWHFIRPWLQRNLPKSKAKIEVQFVGRERSASPAAGSFALHKKQYQAFMDEAFQKANISSRLQDQDPGKRP